MRASTSNTEGARQQVTNQDDEYIADLVPPWRNGPAKMWYDKMNIPNTVTDFDYGFKIKGENESIQTIHELPEEKSDMFLPVNLIRWEDDIIYDGEEIRDQVKILSILSFLSRFWRRFVVESSLLAVGYRHRPLELTRRIYIKVSK